MNHLTTLCDVVHLQSSQNSSDFSPCIENSRSDSNGHLADVKVEEVDLDSVSDDDDDTIGGHGTFQFGKIKDTATAREGKKRRHGSEDNSNQPSTLTLQSFARIPALATQDTIPSFVQNLVDDFPVSINEGRDPNEIPSKNTYFCISHCY